MQCSKYELQMEHLMSEVSNFLDVNPYIIYYLENSLVYITWKTSYC